jgi:acyl-CoA synthetase (AMP-forming)/AMP-acid ligase II
MEAGSFTTWMAVMTTSLWSILHQSASRFSEHPAIIHGNQQINYSRWKQEALACGAWLQTKGVQPGDRVVLWMHASIEMAVAIFGVWAAGGIAVFIDPKSKGKTVSNALATVEPRLILDADGDQPPAEAASFNRVRFSRDQIAGKTGFTPHVALPTEPSSIVFTSGSTGKPKGVTQVHGNLARACVTVGSYLKLTSKDSLLCAIPWSFDYGFKQFHLTAAFGVTHIIPSEPGPKGICDAIIAHRPTFLPGTPSLFTTLLQGLSPFTKTDLTSIRTITNTGGALPPAVLERLIKLLPQAEIFLNYGLTESYRSSFLDPSLVKVKPTSVGKPISGVDIIILRDDGLPAKPKEIGQIIHRGDYIFSGYWNDPEATEAALKPDPLSPEGCPNPPKAIYTGDYGYFDEDGYLYFYGRRDRLVKSMGVRVSLLEIEQMIYGSGLVREVAVIGLPHDILGHEIWAIAVPETKGGDVQKNLAAFAREQMSTYMVPRGYLIVDSLPKTTTGKIDYPSLAAKISASKSGRAA